jgi:type IV secretion system protein VirB2
MIAMLRLRPRRLPHLAVLFALGVSLLGSPAWTSGSSMPWEAPLPGILDSTQGPFAKTVAVMIIIMTGLSLAFGGTSGGFRRLQVDPDRPILGTLRLQFGIAATRVENRS